MAIEVKVPTLPESVADATIVTWHKKAGDAISRDESLVDLETDKVVLEVPAPEDGVLSEILKEEGSTVVAGELLAKLTPGAAPKTEKAASSEDSSSAAPVVATVPSESLGPAGVVEPIAATSSAELSELSPAVRRLAMEHNVDLSQVKGTGKAGKITKSDLESHLSGNGLSSIDKAGLVAQSTAAQPMGVREEKRIPMSRLRARVAERLLEAQHSAAMLTTFNEVNLDEVMELRKRYKDQFEKQHGVKLGFMSFFTKAVIEALKRFPNVNASIDDADIVYHGYFDIGIAVSTDRGLVVPVLRDADQMSMAQIESSIGDFASRARKGQITLEEMTGGTFTITNGGVFGSLLSTPILNPPQSGILGMHKIEERAVVENGQVVVCPMMYLALTYDHRIIDGRESVQFLVTIKQMLEDPSRLLLDV